MKNFYHPEFYQEVQRAPLSRAFKHYYRLVVLLALILTVAVAVEVVPGAIEFKAIVENQAANWFPAELNLEIKDGQVKTNVREPYVIPSPGKSPPFKNLLVIDTQTDFDLKQFNEAETLAWLSRDSLIYRREGSIVVESLKRFPSLTLNQAKIAGWLARLSPWLTALLPILIILIFLGWLAFFSSYLLALLVLALVIRLFGWFKGARLNYGQAYRVALHAVTWPLILKTLAWLVAPGASLFFLPSILLLLIATINLRPLDTNPALS